MNTHPQMQLHQGVFDFQSKQGTKPVCPACFQPRLLWQVAEALARFWASEAPAIRAARALRLGPAIVWLRGGSDLGSRGADYDTHHSRKSYTFNKQATA
jgi:hypothetical protein